MERTQVYLDREVLDLLDSQAAMTGASRSELIRRAVRSTYGGSSRPERLQALQASAGIFKDRNENGQQYVDGLRGDLNSRLTRTFES